MSPEDALKSLSGAWSSIGTMVRGNWAIPQGATLQSRRGPAAFIEDKVMGTEPGRRIMSAVDMWNSLTGGPSMANIVGGLSPESTIGEELQGILPYMKEILQTPHHFEKGLDFYREKTKQ